MGAELRASRATIEIWPDREQSREEDLSKLSRLETAHGRDRGFREQLMKKSKSGMRPTKLSRRTFMELAGSSVVPLGLPIIGPGLHAEPAVLSMTYAEGKQKVVDLYQESFFYAREYFVLRSGRAKMILQADRADLGPALTYLLFDAGLPRQSRSKSEAFNFVPEEGAASSALQVELGGYLFSALGQRTKTRWVTVDGIPAVEAEWWAGGIRVTEQFSAMSKGGLFQRLIRVEGANLMGNQAIRLKLSLPTGRFVGEGRVLVRDGEKCQMGLTIHEDVPVESNLVHGTFDLGPLTIAPHATAEIETALLVQIPPGSVNELIHRSVSLTSTPAVSRRLATKKMWAAATQLTTGDHTVQELFDHARYNLAGMISENGSMDAGIFEYGQQWARDTSNSALGALHSGYFELARAALEKVLSKMISDQGTTMVASHFEKPDVEELDQMGEILHALKAYHDWTGDETLLQEHQAKLMNLVERPLSPLFRDETGMVHDRREYWERTLEDAYELAYQTYLIQGLRDAADLAPAFGAQDRADRWRQEADRTFEALLHHPTRALVDQGHLIKRRNVTGEIADVIPSSSSCLPGAPLCTESFHRLMPDASEALPIAFGIVEPTSPVARGTLDHLEQLWNTRWSDGGYDRYNTSTQPDQPGPWPFASCFILRAQHEAKLYDRSRRTLEWLNTVQGGRSGCWFEEIPSTRSQEPHAGLIPWTCAEVILFVIRHWLGVRFREGRTVIRPNLYPGSSAVSADLRLLAGYLHLEVSGSGSVKHAYVNRRKVQPAVDGSIVLPSGFTSGTVEIFTG